MKWNGVGNKSSGPISKAMQPINKTTEEEEQNCWVMHHNMDIISQMALFKPPMVYTDIIKMAKLNRNKINV